MKRVRCDIQDGFLKRSGWLGRWITIYVHRYSGAKEVSGRSHNHPWRLAIAVVLSGGYDEIVDGEERTRLSPSIHWYKNSDQHRLSAIAPGTLTLFIGLFRKQKAAPCYDRMTRYGAAHYTELESVRSKDVSPHRATESPRA